MTYFKPGINSEISLLLQTLGTFSKFSIFTPNLGQFFKIFHYHSQTLGSFSKFSIIIQTLGTFLKSSIFTPNLGQFFKIFHYPSKPWAVFQNLPLSL